MFLILIIRSYRHTYGTMHMQSMAAVRGVTPDQSDENMEIGRFLHEKAYAREKRNRLLRDEA